jgi:SAM-dependent methyltransferase
VSGANGTAVALPRTAPKCPSCTASDVRIFYEVTGAPVHSVLQMNTAEMAREFPKRNIALGLCLSCGLISNTEFDASLHSYSRDYEETQGYSGTFREFSERLARDIVERYGIQRKTVIEIGCGKGEFLSLLCRIGNNKGIGIDPAFVAERNPALDCDVTFIADFYSETFAALQADAIVCKMTLEHIYDTFEFVSLVRRSIGCRRHTLVFFQVPNTDYVLSETAFQDVYYEHCSYFNPVSLSRLFTRCGFRVLEVKREYDNQYLTLAATPAELPGGVMESGAEFAHLERLTAQFSSRSAIAIRSWRQKVEQAASAGKRVAIWGSGSKGVAFLTALRADDAITYAVDINPHRQGKYMAGSAHRIISPAELAEKGVDIIIAMNGIYRAEIQRSMDELGIKAALLAL